MEDVYKRQMYGRTQGDNHRLAGHCGDSSDGGGDFRSCLELGGNCWVVALISRCGRFRVWSMKSKQLANVLIKIIGLYICVFAIPTFISGIVVGLTNYSIMGQLNGVGAILVRILSTTTTAAAQAVLGILLIVLSQKVARFLFKNEDE